MAWNQNYTIKFFTEYAMGVATWFLIYASEY
jgi:hypothetical protein